jgi:hypothetical protein
MSAHILSTPVDFASVEDTLMALWLDACRLQFEGKDWEAIAHAWMAVARACPLSALQDRAIFSQLAGEAAQKALGILASS